MKGTRSMLYLVRPDTSMSWVDLPAGVVMAQARTLGVDLAKLGWQRSTWRAGWVEISLALRHGVACSTGLVIPGAIVAALERPSLPRRAGGALTGAVQDVRATDAAINRIVPGWVAAGRTVAAAIDAATGDAIAGALLRIRDLFTAPVDRDLVTHWRVLGGEVPQGH